MAKLPNDSVKKARFTALREQTRNTFVPLQEEERHLHLLMEISLSHILEVLAPVLQPVRPTYCKNPVAETTRRASADLHSKA